MNDIRHYAKIALENPKKLLEMLTESENQQKQKERIDLEKAYRNSKNRLTELENLLQRLFEENVAGRLNDSNYEMMFSKYQSEQESLKTFADELSNRLTSLNEVKDSCEKWIDLIAKYSDLQELDSEIVNELCEKILIYEPTKGDGRRTQRIEIFYRFVGQIPELIEEKPHEIIGTAALGVSRKKEKN